MTRSSLRREVCPTSSRVELQAETRPFRKSRTDHGPESADPLSPILSPCPVPQCRRLTTGGRCPEHRRADAVRRIARKRRNGTDSTHWRRVRAVALELASYRCQECGTSRDLIGHLRPELDGQHRRATPADVRVLCRRCHSRHHALKTPLEYRGGRKISGDRDPSVPASPAWRYGEIHGAYALTYGQA